MPPPASGAPRIVLSPWRWPSRSARRRGRSPPRRGCSPPAPGRRGCRRCRRRRAGRRGSCCRWRWSSRRCRLRSPGAPPRPRAQIASGTPMPRHECAARARGLFGWTPGCEPYSLLALALQREFRLVTPLLSMQNDCGRTTPVSESLRSRFRHRRTSDAKPRRGFAPLPGCWDFVLTRAPQRARASPAGLHAAEALDRVGDGLDRVRNSVDRIGEGVTATRRGTLAAARRGSLAAASRRGTLAAASWRDTLAAASWRDTLAAASWRDTLAAASWRDTLAAAWRATLAAARRVGLIAAWRAAGLTALSVDGGSQARGRASRAVLRLGLGAGRCDRDLRPASVSIAQPGGADVGDQTGPDHREPKRNQNRGGCATLDPARLPHKPRRKEWQWSQPPCRSRLPVRPPRSARARAQTRSRPPVPRRPVATAGLR